jgi:hypothetical protein
MVWLFFFASSSVFAQEKWPGFPFKEVRAYAWPPTTETEAVILPDKKLERGVLNKDGALLTTKEVLQLRAAVSGRHAEYPAAACYVPHNAFIFYDSSHTPIAFLEVCFSCLGFRAEPKTAQNIDWLSLAAIFSQHGLPMGEYRDFQSFNKAFAALVKKSSEGDAR